MVSVEDGRDSGKDRQCEAGTLTASGLRVYRERRGSRRKAYSKGRTWLGGSRFRVIHSALLGSFATGMNSLISPRVKEMRVFKRVLWLVGGRGGGPCAGGVWASPRSNTPGEQPRTPALWGSGGEHPVPLAPPVTGLWGTCPTPCPRGPADEAPAAPGRCFLPGLPSFSHLPSPTPLPASSEIASKVNNFHSNSRLGARFWGGPNQDASREQKNAGESRRKSPRETRVLNTSERPNPAEPEGHTAPVPVLYELVCSLFCLRESFCLHKTDLVPPQADLASPASLCLSSLCISLSGHFCLVLNLRLPCLALPPSLSFCSSVGVSASISVPLSLTFCLILSVSLSPCLCDYLCCVSLSCSLSLSSSLHVCLSLSLGHFVPVPFCLSL